MEDGFSRLIMKQYLTIDKLISWEVNAQQGESRFFKSLEANLIENDDDMDLLAYSDLGSEGGWGDKIRKRQNSDNDDNSSTASSSWPSVTDSQLLESAVYRQIQTIAEFCHTKCHCTVLAGSADYGAYEKAQAPGDRIWEIQEDVLEWHFTNSSSTRRPRANREITWWKGGFGRPIGSRTDYEFFQYCTCTTCHQTSSGPFSCQKDCYFKEKNGRYSLETSQRPRIETSKPFNAELRFCPLYHRLSYSPTLLSSTDFRLSG